MRFTQFLLTLILVTNLFSSLQAQDFCRKALIYFDSDHDQPLEKSRETLDAILAEMGKRAYLVEVTGHTDSDAEDAYNTKLSLRRAANIRDYVHAHGTGKYDFRVFHRGERQPVMSNVTEEQKAKNRRVEVAIVPMEDSLLKFAGGSGAFVNAPLTLFGDCPICDDPPILTYWAGEAAAAANGVPLLTTGNETLITAGMLNLTSSCLNKESPGEMEYCIPAEIFDSNMVAWELNADSSGWDGINAKVTYDSVNKQYCMRWSGKNFKNWDCYKRRERRTFYADPYGLPNGMIVAYKFDSLPGAARDTIKFHPGDTLESLLAARNLMLWGDYFEDQRVYRAFPPEAITTVSTISALQCVSVKHGVIDQAKIPAFPVIPNTDTTLVIKMRGFAPGVQPELAFPDLDIRMTVKEEKARKFTTSFPGYKHKLALKGVSTVTPFAYKAVKVRYRKRKKRLKVKIKKKWLDRL